MVASPTEKSPAMNPTMHVQSLAPIPAPEAVREQIATISERGLFKMLDVSAVLEALGVMEMDDAISWIEEDRGRYLAAVFVGFTKP